MSSNIGTVRKLKVKEASSIPPISSSLSSSSMLTSSMSISLTERNTSEQLRLTNITLLEENAELRRRIMAIKKQLSGSIASNNDNGDEANLVADGNESVSDTSGNNNSNHHHHHHHHHRHQYQALRLRYYNRIKKSSP